MMRVAMCMRVEAREITAALHELRAWHEAATEDTRVTLNIADSCASKVSVACAGPFRGFVCSTWADGVMLEGAFEEEVVIACERELGVITNMYLLVTAGDRTRLYGVRSPAAVE